MNQRKISRGKTLEEQTFFKLASYDVDRFSKIENKVQKIGNSYYLHVPQNMRGFKIVEKIITLSPTKQLVLREFEKYEHSPENL